MQNKKLLSAMKKLGMVSKLIRLVKMIIKETEFNDTNQYKENFKW